MIATTISVEDISASAAATAKVNSKNIVNERNKEFQDKNHLNRSPIKSAMS